MKVPTFQRVSDAPLLGPDAVPWCEPSTVVKGGATSRSKKEVRRTIMHPSVIEATRYRKDAPARYLMYYAPHHSQGIGAAAADELTGPWTPLAENPLVRLDQFRGIKGHVSGPDVVWVPEESRFRMYLHGSVPQSEQQTGLAVSPDGVHFEPADPDPILPHPYLRVWRWDGLYYGVCRFGNDLGLVRSEDGMNWQEWPNGLLLERGPQHGEYDRLRHHCVHVIEDVLHLYYCTYRDAEESVEAIRLAAMPMRGEWTEWRIERLGDALTPALDWEQENVRDPYIIEADGRVYMFYVGGNEAGISLAVQTR